MTKPYVTVSVTVHGNDTPLEIADYVDDAGRFVAIGTQAAAMLGREQAIHFVDAEGAEYIIPYHAIVAYSITKTSDEYTKLEDEYCVVDPCIAEQTCHQSWTITFANGEEKLQESLVKDGETPVYEGSTPTKTETGYTCEFIGWNTSADAETALEAIPAATAAATYYAIFTCTPDEP